MAFPAVASTSQGNNAAGTSHTVNLPADISPSQLLVAYLCHDTFDAVSSINWPAGWTELFEEEWRDIGGGGTGSYQLRWAIAYRFTDGTEGASITVTTTKADSSSYIVHRITGAHASSPPETAQSRAQTATPDPPSLSPSWGAEDTLWLPGVGWNNGTTTCTAAPASYTDLVSQADGASSGQGVATARRELNSASENPGTFTLSALETHLVANVAIRPAAAVVGSARVRAVQSPMRW